MRPFCREQRSPTKRPGLTSSRHKERVIMDKKQEHLSRRDFMKVTGVTTAAGLVAGRLSDGKALGARARTAVHSKIIGANDRINYGFIGVGGMGSGHLRIIKEFSEKENLTVLGVCDVFDKRRRLAQSAIGLSDS